MLFTRHAICMGGRSDSHSSVGIWAQVQKLTAFSKGIFMVVGAVVPCAVDYLKPSVASCEKRR